MSQLSHRLAGLDLARGATVFYVVCVIHGLFWLHLGAQPFISLLLFEMPPIFFCAGAAYGLQTRSTAERQPASLTSYARLLLSKAVRILLPYWAYVTACLMLMTAAHAVPATTIAEWLAVVWPWFNPMSFERPHALHPLDWHLWFVPVYLLVIGALPLVAKLGRQRRPHLAALVLGVAALEYLLSEFAPQEHDASKLARYVICYLPYAWLGSHWVQQPSRTGLLAQLPVTAAVCLAALVLLSLVKGWASIWTIQQHKFPPDHVLVLFGMMWMTVLLWLCTVWSAPGKLAHACRNVLLTPFIRFGYSIYLWQGMGYLLAIHLARKLGMGPWPTWLLAVALSIGLGYIASPIERLRLRRSQPQTQPRQSG